MKYLLLFFMLLVGSSLMAQIPVYLDETQFLDDRVEDALNRMTEGEKQELVRTCTEIRSSGVPRLGIPPFVVDTLPNHRFPSFESLAATWNPDLSWNYGHDMAEQALYQRVDAVYDSGLWQMSEDSYLVSLMVPPYIDGVNYCGEVLLDEWRSLGTLKDVAQDELLRHVLRLYFKTSMNRQRPIGFLGTEDQKATSKTVAEESIVLLRNQRDILPLRGLSVRKVLLIGPYPMEGLKEEIALHGITIDCESCNWSEAYQKASSADIVIFTENVSDRGEVPFLKNVPVVIQAWDLGDEGVSALAAVLCGDTNPSGKLPFTWPGNNDDMPFFALGHGLSYTTFEFTDFNLSGREIPIGGDLVGTVTVTNTGDREGYVVVQLYIHDITSSMPKPDKELKGFQKVWLQPGDSQEVQFVINESSLMFYDETTQQWWAEPGFYVAFVGDAMDRLPLKARFHLK